MAERRTLADRFRGLIRWLLIAALVCAAVIVVGRHFIATQLDTQIRAQVEQLLAARYPELSVRVRSAQRLVGRGIELRGVSIVSRNEASGYRELVYIDEVQLACQTDLADLMAGQPYVRRLTIRRMKIRATRHQDGSWNIARLFALPQTGSTIPEIVIDNSTIELRDLSKPTTGTWALRDITVQAVPGVRDDGIRFIKLTGSMLGDHFKRVAITGWVDPVGGGLSVKGTVDGLEASSRMLDALPNDVAGYLTFLQTLRARAHLAFQVSRHPDQKTPIQWTVQGPITEGRIDDPRLPYPLTGVAAEVYCDNQRLELRNVTARSGSSQLALSCRCDNFLSSTPQLRVAAAVQQLSLDRQLFQVLPASMQAEWQKFDPSGTIDASLTLTYDGTHLQPELHLTCRDVEFSYHKFPYRMRHGQGVIDFVNDTVSASQFTAQAGAQTVYFSGRFTHPGPAAIGKVTVRSAGPLPVDENLIAAMQPSGQKAVRALHPTGTITVTRAEFERRANDPVSHSLLEVEMHDCTIEYDRFPYPIQKITGTVFARDRYWTFEKLRGYHDGAYIQARGQWAPADEGKQGGELTFNFQCYDVPMDDALRHAVGKMNSGAEHFWASVRPRGTVDHLSATVYHDARTEKTSLEVSAEKWPPGQNLDGRSISVHPTWLPLRMEDVTGSIWFADGRFELRNLKATHGPASLQMNGHGSASRDGPWDVTLDRVTVDRVHMDDELIEALPGPMRPALRSLKLRGAMGLDGSIWFRGGEGLALTSGWDIGIDIENGAMDNQLALEHIHGGVRLFGNKWPEGFSSHGELKVDSLMCRGVQVTRVQGPLWMDSHQLILGTRAEANRTDRPPRQMTANLWGGTSALDGTVQLNDPLTFTLDLSLANGHIDQLARSLGSSQRDLTGKAFGTLHLTGSQAGTHTFRGAGQVRLIDADIYELPVMVAMLSVLSLRPPNTTAFTRADIDYRLNGDQIYLDRIDFSGAAVSLKGSGWMDLSRQIHLSFYALVGRSEFQVPLVSALLAEASRNILAIDVAGTVDHPLVTRKPLPELDGTLKKLFPEIEPARAGTPRGLPSMGWKLPGAGLWSR